MEERYKRALNYIKSGKGNQPDNSDKLSFYGLFKQITEGPPKSKAPSRLKVVERAKYDAWATRAKLSKEQAMQEYINILTKITPDWEKDAKL